MEMNTNLKNLIDVLRAHKNDLTLPEDIYNAMTKYFSEEEKETEYRMDIRIVPKSTSPYALAYDRHYKILASNEVELAKEIFSYVRPFLINSELKISCICMEKVNSEEITCPFVIHHKDRPDTIYAIDIEDVRYANTWKYYVRFRSGKPVIKPGEAVNCIATIHGILYQYSKDEIANLIMNENAMNVFDVLIVNTDLSTKYCIYSNAENAVIRL